MEFCLIRSQITYLAWSCIIPIKRWTLSHDPSCMLKEINIKPRVRASDYESCLSHIFFLSRYLKFRVWRINRILSNDAITSSIRRFNFYYVAKILSDNCNVNKCKAKYAINLIYFRFSTLATFIIAYTRTLTKSRTTLNFIDTFVSIHRL